MAQPPSRLQDAFRGAKDAVAQTVQAAGEDNVPMMAAALSYYLLVTIIPLALAAAIVVASSERVRQAVSGSGAAAIIPSLPAGSTTFAVVSALVVVVFGASAVFSQFVLAVTRIWKQKSQAGPLRAFARTHALALLLLGVLSLGLFVSLIVGAVFAAIVGEVTQLAVRLGLTVPELDLVFNGRVIVDLLASFVLFLTAFTVIPARPIRLRDAAPGALMTATAYALGQVWLGVFLSTSRRVAMYGSMGGLVALLLWAYYSAMIALYGAELTRVIVLRREKSDWRSRP